MPTFRDYPFTIDEIGTCNQLYKLVPLKSHDIKNQGGMRHPCIACMRHTNMIQASMCCPKECKNGEFQAFICTECYFKTVPSTAIAIACMKKDCAKLEMVAAPKVVGDDAEIKVPMRLRSAMAEILRIHNSPTAIKPQDIEDVEACGLLNDLKEEDETIVI